MITEADFPFIRRVDLDISRLRGRHVPKSCRYLESHGTIWADLFEAYLEELDLSGQLEYYRFVRAYERAHAKLPDALASSINHLFSGGNLHDKPRLLETLRQNFRTLKHKFPHVEFDQELEQYSFKVHELKNVYQAFALVMTNAVEFAERSPSAGQRILEHNLGGRSELLSAHRDFLGQATLFEHNTEEALLKWAELNDLLPHDQLATKSKAYNHLLTTFRSAKDSYRECLDAAETGGGMENLSEEWSTFQHALAEQMDLLYDAAYIVVNWAKEHAKDNMRQNFRGEFPEVANGLLIVKVGWSKISLLPPIIGTMVGGPVGAIVGTGTALLGTAVTKLTDFILRHKELSDAVHDRDTVVQHVGMGVRRTKEEEDFATAASINTYGATPVNQAAGNMGAATGALTFAEDIAEGAELLSEAASPVIKEAGMAFDLYEEVPREYVQTLEGQRILQAQTAVGNAWDLLKGTGLPFQECQYHGYVESDRSFRVTIDGHLGTLDEQGCFYADDGHDLADRVLTAARDPHRYWGAPQDAHPLWDTLRFSKVDQGQYWYYDGEVALGEGDKQRLFVSTIVVDTGECQWTALLPDDMPPPEDDVLHGRLAELRSQIDPWDDNRDGLIEWHNNEPQFTEDPEVWQRLGLDRENRDTWPEDLLLVPGLMAEFRGLRQHEERVAGGYYER
ncbi:hypothetical protein K4749_12260 [Streptomyces sp. TRM72054]|uniref:hypothetical protein n=1 Tax=Streptomyces sp. TRM72054 TaxID=2870562 RepID=UPI001C8C7C88|nr:hypothetical protein [Streptomyces sp. TRM72054]MBX9394353.1 hypothetical protein [Streptomyces sp. TRM72054]